MSDVRVAQIGGGYWGRNLARNHHALGALAAICDADPARLAEQGKAYPGVDLHADVAAVLADPRITAVSLATPPHTHGPLIRAALAAGKDVYVEKPLCHELIEARELAALATSRGRVLMVGHLLRYHPCVERIVQELAAGTLGTVRYLESRRLNIGSIPTERSVLWNFGPHDATLVLAALPEPVCAVACHGGAWIRPGCQDEVTIRVRTAGGAHALIALSWIHPIKEQRFLLHGERGSLVFDDTLPWAQKLRHFPGWDGVQDGRAGTRELPAPVALDVPEAEPLRRECAHFLDCCRTRRESLTGTAQALAVQALLDAAQRSLDAGGAEVAASA